LNGLNLTNEDHFKNRNIKLVKDTKTGVEVSALKLAYNLAS